MRSKTSSCEKTIFLKELTRFWPLWAAYLVVLLLAMPVALQSSLDAARDHAGEVYSFLTSLNMLPDMHLVITAIMSCLTAMALYSYLYTARSASFAASLPIKRGRTFLTHFFAGLCWLVLVNVIAFGLYAAVAAAHGVGHVDAVFGVLAMNVLFILFFYGFASFCAVLTGNIIVLPIVYGVLNFTAVVTEWVASTLLRFFVFGMPDSFGNKLTFLSPSIELAGMCGLHFEKLGSTEQLYPWNYLAEELPQGFRIVFDGFLTAGIYALVGVVLVVLAVLIYRRRHMETAGDVVAVKIAKPIFRWCLTFGCALVIGWLLFQIVCVREPSGVACAAAVAACMIVGAFIGYFAAEMLMQKSFRVFRGRWGGFLITVLVVLVFVAVFEFDLFGYEKHVPEAENVKGVSLMYDTLLEEPENIEAVTELHRSIVGQKDRYDAMEDEYYYSRVAPRPVTLPYDSEYELNVRTVRFLYTLKNGSTLEREYTITFSEKEWATAGTDANALENLVNCREAIARRKETPVSVTANSIYAAEVSGQTAKGYENFSLVPQEAAELYECIAQDMDEGTIGRIWLCCGEEYENTVYDGYISITLRLPEGEDRYFDFSTTPTKDAVHTDEFLRAHGIELLTVREEQELDQYGPYGPRAVYA